MPDEDPEYIDFAALISTGNLAKVEFFYPQLQLKTRKTLFELISEYYPPGYRDSVKKELCELPPYINAEYVLLQALLGKGPFACPAFTMAPNAHMYKLWDLADEQTTETDSDSASLNGTFYDLDYCDSDSQSDKTNEQHQSNDYQPKPRILGRTSADLIANMLAQGPSRSQTPTVPLENNNYQPHDSAACHHQNYSPEPMMDDIGDDILEFGTNDIVEEIVEDENAATPSAFARYRPNAPYNCNALKMDILSNAIQPCVEPVQPVAVDLTQPLASNNVVVEYDLTKPGPSRRVSFRGPMPAVTRFVDITNDTARSTERFENSTTMMRQGAQALKRQSNEAGGAIPKVFIKSSPPPPKSCAPVGLPRVPAATTNDSDTDEDDAPGLTLPSAADTRVRPMHPGEKKLVNTLAEIFCDCELDYIRRICRGFEFSTANIEHFTDVILQNDYPKKEELVEVDFETQLENVRSLLPDADPDYLAEELRKITNQADLQYFINRAMETKSYPKAAEIEKNKKMRAQISQYTTLFNPVDFLKLIPDPETYYADPNCRVVQVDKSSASYLLMAQCLKNVFSKVSVKQINTELRASKTFIEAANKLTDCKKGLLINRRKQQHLVESSDIPLLQMFAYVTHRSAILATREAQLKAAADRRQVAIANGEVNTCACCYDEEVMPEDTIRCESGCVACKECIRSNTEILFAENRTNFPCLLDCGAHFSLEVLQSCIGPKLFCKIAKLKQLEEVKAAGIGDLEFCTSCDFAAIPAQNDRIFKCLNPECMRETCRECKEPSHIPLRCDEVERDVEVKNRVYIENRMTEALMRQCGNCKMKFIKADGCNRMTCSNCFVTMCYICQKSAVTYEHFNGQGANHAGRCPLYSNTDLLHEEIAIASGKRAKEELGIKAMKVDPLSDAEMRIEQARKKFNMPGVVP